MTSVTEIRNEAIVPTEQLPCNSSRDQQGHLFQGWDSTSLSRYHHWSSRWKSRNLEWDSLVLACLVACIRHRNPINHYLWMESPAAMNQKHPNYAFGINNGKDSFSLPNWQERSFLTRKKFWQLRWNLLIWQENITKYALPSVTEGPMQQHQARFSCSSPT